MRQRKAAGRSCRAGLLRRSGLRPFRRWIPGARVVIGTEQFDLPASGGLRPGQSVEVVNDMSFDVRNTDKS